MLALPKWVFRDIDKIRRGFLWSGLDISKPKCRLVVWSDIYKSKSQEGWGILNLTDFNQALLDKWWWKISTHRNFVWSDIVFFIYKPSRGLISFFHSIPRTKSFFWSGILKCREVFIANSMASIKDGHDTSFWLDWWSYDSILTDKWADIFSLWRDPHMLIT